MQFPNYQGPYQQFVYQNQSFYPRRVVPSTEQKSQPFLSNKIKKIIGNYSYDPNDKIGSGYSSNVYKGINEKTGEQVAIKVIDLHQITTPISQTLLKNEIQVLRQLDSPNLLKVYDIILTQNNTYIITEFCEQGDLADLIKKHKKLDEEAALEILSQLMKGMKALQNRKILHRDIKPANILIRNGVFKLADFGFAVPETVDSDDDSILQNFNVGTRQYMSPEIIAQNYYSEKSDIWAVGIVFYEMIHGFTPYKAPSESQILNQYLTEPLNIANNNISKTARSLIQNMLKLDASTRYGIDAVIALLSGQGDSFTKSRSGSMTHAQRDNSQDGKTPPHPPQLDQKYRETHYVQNDKHRTGIPRPQKQPFHIKKFSDYTNNVFRTKTPKPKEKKMTIQNNINEVKKKLTNFINEREMKKNQEIQETHLQDNEEIDNQRLNQKQIFEQKENIELQKKEHEIKLSQINKTEKKITSQQYTDAILNTDDFKIENINNDEILQLEKLVKELKYHSDDTQKHSQDPLRIIFQERISSENDLNLDVTPIFKEIKIEDDEIIEKHLNPESESDKQENQQKIYEEIKALENFPSSEKKMIISSNEQEPNKKQNKNEKQVKEIISVNQPEIKKFETNPQQNLIKNTFQENQQVEQKNIEIQDNNLKIDKISKMPSQQSEEINQEQKIYPYLIPEFFNKKKQIDIIQKSKKKPKLSLSINNDYVDQNQTNKSSHFQMENNYKYRFNNYINERRESVIPQTSNLNNLKIRSHPQLPLLPKMEKKVQVIENVQFIRKDDNLEFCKFMESICELLLNNTSNLAIKCIFILRKCVAMKSQCFNQEYKLACEEKFRFSYYQLLQSPKLGSLLKGDRRFEVLFDLLIEKESSGFYVIVLYYINEITREYLQHFKNKKSESQILNHLVNLVNALNEHKKCDFEIEKFIWNPNFDLNIIERAEIALQSQ